MVHKAAWFIPDIMDLARPDAVGKNSGFKALKKFSNQQP